METVLVTGGAGFIGFHLIRALVRNGLAVVGVDDFNAYYSPSLKRQRAAVLTGLPGVRLYAGDVAQTGWLAGLVTAQPEITAIIHLAAQPGVLFSNQHPAAAATGNILAHLQVLETARRLPRLRHLVYASTSSVYGADSPVPFRTDAPPGRPASVYGAAKQANEILSNTHAALFGLPVTALRLFTVYGPWGRPDMAVWLFTEALLRGQPIQLRGGGQMARDYTYIDDIVAGIIAALNRPPAAGTHRIYNLGNSQPETTASLLALLEKHTGRTGQVTHSASAPGELPRTCADITLSMRDLEYRPQIALAEGTARFVSWYQDYTGGKAC